MKKYYDKKTDKFYEIVRVYNLSFFDWYLCKNENGNLITFIDYK